MKLKDICQRFSIPALNGRGYVQLSTAAEIDSAVKSGQGTAFVQSTVAFADAADVAANMAKASGKTWHAEERGAGRNRFILITAQGLSADTASLPY